MKWCEPIYDLIGAAVPFYDLLPETTQGTIKWIIQPINGIIGQIY